MVWVYKAPTPHTCLRPPLASSDVPGSIWECDGCGAQWEVFPTHQIFGPKYRWITVPRDLRVQAKRKK